nr:unnamed protein product [Callosobruchus analis]
MQLWKAVYINTSYILNFILLENNHHLKSIDPTSLLYTLIWLVPVYFLYSCGEPYQITPVTFRTLYFAKKIIISTVLIYIILPVHYLLHAYCLTLYFSKTIIILKVLLYRILPVHFLFLYFDLYCTSFFAVDTFVENRIH